MPAASDPMLVSEGRLIEMSSPNGRRGHFYENWCDGEGVERSRSRDANARASLPNSCASSGANSVRCFLSARLSGRRRCRGYAAARPP